ncbi:MAG: hypothetical protein JWR38_1279 [Mucilaginibacter sp.]|nr:hypothetical protein [Mucilaginibacter sp.]
MALSKKNKKWLSAIILTAIIITLIDYLVSLLN